MSVSITHRRILGEAIRARRRRLHLSQEKLAEKADLSSVFISGLERGTETISFDKLVKLAKALHIRVRTLVRHI